jgi:hypothetical protein
MTGEGGEGEGENCHMLITSPLNEGGRDKKWDPEILDHKKIDQNIEEHFRRSSAYITTKTQEN